METKKNCSERMRPILQAMERSIDAARRVRTGSTAVETPVRPRPASFTLAPATPAPAPASVIASVSDQSSPPRLKARPKRFDSPVVNPFENAAYRAKVG